MDKKPNKDDKAEHLNTVKKLKGQLNHEKMKNVRNQKKIHELNRRIAQTETKSHESASTQVLQELIHHENVPPNRRRYSGRLLKISAIIFLISFSVYLIIRQIFPSFPSIVTISNYLRTVQTLKEEMLLNIKFVPSLVFKYKHDNSIEEDEQIKCILSVDAASFSPQVKIDVNGKVNGIDGIESINSEKLTELNETWKTFEKFVKTNSKVLFNNLFVYYLQPLSHKYPCTIIHIIKDVNGKAREEHINTLFQIRELVKKAKVEIVGFAFDGDSSYKKLHYDYFHRLSQNNGQDIYPYIISDPLHLLKRARYRLLSNKIHSGFYIFNSIVDLNGLPSLLNLPTIYFSSQKVTKMHDILPLNLFTIENLMQLYNNNKIPELIYFFPFCIFNSVHTNKKMKINVRYGLLKICEAYFRSYLNCLKTIGKDKLKETKRKDDDDVILFKEDFVIEFLNTIETILNVIENFQDFDTHRIGSNPLEHYFGRIRMRSKYYFNYETLIKSAIDANTLKHIQNQISIDLSIYSRTKTYGFIKADNEEFNLENVFQYSYEMIAYSIQNVFNLPIEIENYALKKSDIQNINLRDVAESFFVEIGQIISVSPKKINTILSTNSITVTQGKSIRKRLETSNFEFYEISQEK